MYRPAAHRQGMNHFALPAQLEAKAQRLFHYSSLSDKCNNVLSAIKNNY